MNSAEVAELLNDIATIYGTGANPQLNSRRVLPRPDNTPEALARHRVQANAIGSRAQWFQLPGESKPVLRTVSHKAGGGLQVGAPLASRHHLAAFGTGERQRFALDLNELAPYFYTNMPENQIEQQAKQKYAYINHRGKAAHHMLPISFMARVKQGLQSLGIDSPVIDELILRKMYQGDTPGNLAMAGPNPEEKAKGAEGLEQVISPYDEHKLIHDTAEANLKDINILNADGSINETIDLLDVNRVSDGSPRAVNEYDVDPFMTSGATPLQKQAFGMAVPQAHRVGLQEVKLPIKHSLYKDEQEEPNYDEYKGVENVSEARRVRQLKEKTMLHSDAMKATTEFSPLTQQILSDMYGKTPKTVDVSKSLRTYSRRR